MKKLIIALLVAPSLAYADDIALPDPDSAEAAEVASVPARDAASGGVEPALPFTMSAPEENANTLSLVGRLQERRALIEARAEVENARARLQKSECEANRGCSSGPGSMASIAPPPADAVRGAVSAVAAATFTIGGIYKRAGTAPVADLFVNGGRVSVEEGSVLPGGYRVAAITTAGVTVVDERGRKTALSFAQPLDVRGR